MGSYTVYSHELLGKRKREPYQLQSAGQLLDTFRREPAGAWSDNRFEQVQHFRDVIYVAIRSIMDLIGGADFAVQRRRKPNRRRTTFGKSVAATQQHGRDEDYTPFDDADHPLAKLLHRPNCTETMGELAAKLTLQNRLTGVGPLWCVPNAKGRPVELWPLKTPLTTPIFAQTQQYPNGAWRVQPYSPGAWAGPMPGGIASTGAILPGEEVKRFMDPHPLIDWDGFSPLTAGARLLDVLESIDDSRKSAMDNGLQLDAVLMAPGIGEANATRIQAKFENRHKGARNAKKFAVIDPGEPTSPGDKFDLKTLSQTAKDMEYTQGWEQMVKFVLALFGVPASVAGLAGTTSYSELYAALRQFHYRQASFVGRLETWLTKILAWPWSSFPDEYLVRVKLPALDDPDLREQQFGRQLQYDLLTYNEARAKDDLDPVEGGELPVSIYIAKMQQEIAPPPPDPGMMGGDPAAGGMPGMDGEEVPGAADGMPAGDDDEESTQNAVLDAAMEALSVPSEVEEQSVQKAVVKRSEGEKWQGRSGRWFTLKGGRVVPMRNPNAAAKPAAGEKTKPTAKPAANSGATGKWTPEQTAKYQSERAAGKSHVDAVTTARTNPAAHAPAAAGVDKSLDEVRRQLGYGDDSPVLHPQRVAAAVKKVPASTDAQKATLGRAHEWAVTMAGKHADRVAAHLGISRALAHHLLGTAIMHLAKQAISGSGGDGSVSLPGSNGKRLKVSVGRKQGGPTAGAVPGVKNRAAEGTRPPMAKAMNTMSLSAGGALVEESTRRTKRRKKLKGRAARYAKAVVDSL